MFQKFLHFIKYNNAAIIVVLLVFLLGAGAFASETGQKIVGGKETRVEGVDNVLLLASDPDSMDMDYKIGKVYGDEKYYYIVYTYIDLVNKDSAWQYRMNEKEMKILKSIKEDLGNYVADKMIDLHDARVKELKAEREKANAGGEEKRVEITEYSGLLGKALDVASGIFEGYESVKKVELASPVVPAALLMLKENRIAAIVASSSTDNITTVYKNYIESHDPDSDNIFGAIDNCPLISNPDQKDSDNNGMGDACEGEVDGHAAGDEPAGQSATSSESIETVPTQVDTRDAGTDNAGINSPLPDSQDTNERSVQVIDLERESSNTSNSPNTEGN
jgi:hypothetical protein